MLEKKALESTYVSTLKIGKNCKTLTEEPKDDLDKCRGTYHVYLI